MRRLLLIPALLCAVPLSGCAGLMNAVTGIPASPAAVANKTTLDESGILGVELAYKAERILLEAGVDGGKLKGARATQMAALDNKAFAAVQIARRAYQAANATDYATGLADARLAIADALAVGK